MRARSCFCCLSVVGCFFAFAAGCDSHDETTSTGSVKDVRLETYKADLLNIAFDAASAMPANPHIKSRSLAQEKVVTACLELEQPERALKYIEQIDNWRRGAGFADLALYHVRHGAMKKKVEMYLDRSAEFADQTEDWRRDLIRVKIAQTHELLGQHQQALALAANLEDSQSGKVARVKAMTQPSESFDEQMKELDALVSTGNFDIVKNALGAYRELFNRFYTDTERRALIKSRLKASWGNMPISIRIDLLMELASSSLAHVDRETAFGLVNETGRMMESASWQPRFEIPLRAGLAELRFAAGDEKRARADLLDALDMFDANRQGIVNIDKAGILRSVAEAYQTMGDTEAARKIYRRALEAGIENPNSRPRAEDLAATCCSMALHGVEPGEDLFSRIREILDGLGDPW